MWNDLNFWRGIITLLSFLSFLGILAWAWFRGRNNGYADAASLPFDDDDQLEPLTSKGKRHE